MKIFFKILKLIGVIFLLIIPSLRVWINYESSFYQYLYYLLVLVLFVMLAIKIFKNTKNKKINTSIAILLFLIILDMIYYENLSMKIEPLIHIHNKYNIPYSSMEIIETKKSNNPIVGIYQAREAIIKIDNKYISLYYGSTYTYDKEGWKDDYTTSNLLSDTLNKFTNKRKYYKNSYDFNSYTILMEKTASYDMLSVIESLNRMTTYLQDFSYDITFVDNYRYETLTSLSPAHNTSLIEKIAYINYKHIDNYYNKNDFLSKQYLTENQRKKIEEIGFDGFEFVYYANSNNVDIWGYKYKK